MKFQNETSVHLFYVYARAYVINYTFQVNSKYLWRNVQSQPIRLFIDFEISIEIKFTLCAPKIIF